MSEMNLPAISRRERKKRDTRKRILDAAMQLMADTPYDQVRIEDICATADVANATFFLHFSNKPALVFAFNEEVASKIAGELTDAKATASDRLRTLLRVYLSEWGSHSHLMRQIVLEFVNQPEAASNFNDLTPSLLNLVRGVINQGQEKGEFSATISSETAALSLVAAWNALAISWAKTGDTHRAAEAHRQTLDIFLKGLANCVEQSHKTLSM